MLALAGDACNQRQARLFQLKSNVPPFPWVLPVGCSIVLTLFAVFSGLKHGLVHGMLAAVFAACLSSIPVSIHRPVYPLEGSIPIGARTVSEAIGAVLHERPAQPVG